MKCRFGYVSNSSSSSFLVCCDKIDSFDWLKSDDEGYESFLFNMQHEDNKSDQKIRQFLFDEYMDVLYEYEHFLLYKEKSWFHEQNVDPLLRLVSICHKLHSDSKEIPELIKKGMKTVEQSLESEAECEDVLEELALKFANILLLEAKKHWLVISTFSYSDECGDFGSHMEHEFMYEIVHSEQESGGEFSIIDRNEH